MKKVALAAGALIIVAGVCAWYVARPEAPQAPAEGQSSEVQTQPQTIPHSMVETTVSLPNGKQLALSHPDNYQITVAASGFVRPRFMAMSPDGRLFVGEMYSASDTQLGRVLILSGFDSQSGTFATSSVYLSGLRNPNSVAFYTDPGRQEWLYIALTDKLVRYRYQAGDTKPEGAPQIVATFPDYGNSYAEGGWHLTRTVIVHGNKLYVSVGSSCDSCEEKPTEPERASILVMNPDGSDESVYANGLRNAVGIGFAGDQLFATENNSDKLGNDRPADELYKVLQGDNFGWPYCYEFDHAILPNTSKEWQTPIDCSRVPLAFAELGPHSAPLGFAYIDGAFVVALHGSGNKDIGTGYKVVLVAADGEVSDFITGFLSGGTVFGRPVDVLESGNGSFFLTDDFNGAVYYVRKVT